MAKQVSLRGKARRLNRIIENVENWFIVLNGNEFNPPKHPNINIWWDTHDNLLFGAKVEMHGFGEIYKISFLTSTEYKLLEIPKKMWRVVWDELYNPEGQDGANPIIVEKDEEYKKRGLDPTNTVATVAKWWPPDDYVHELVTKRNFMTAPEFEVYAKLIDDMHKEHGGKAPDYIVHEPFVQVSEKVH